MSPWMMALSFVVSGLCFCLGLVGGCGSLGTGGAAPGISYRGMVNVVAYGDSPNAPAGTPTEKKVTLKWAAFKRANANTQYALFRVASGGTVDTTSLTSACTSTTLTSCLVCQVTGGTSTAECTDTEVASSPAVYDYAVVEIKSGAAEAIPTLDSGTYGVKVQIPPDNMVLVHRNAVNWQTCQFLGKESDPVNHNRCAYSGLGATPVNSGPGKAALGLSSDYYDFGYNLFVDRWEAGCNWTPSPACSSGDCFGTGTPGTLGAVGSVGNVYYNTSTGDCYIKTGVSTWTSLNAGAGILAADRVLAYTNAPGASSARIPPLVQISQNRSWDICQAQVDPNYGAKRLLRRREFVAAAGWPYWSGDPLALSDSAISSLESGMTHGSTSACNANTHDGVSAAAFNSASYELARGVASGPENFTLGSTGTSNCVSRYGVQDMVGNVWEWTSDQLGTYNSVARTVSGVSSALDSGNTDWNSLVFDGTLNPGGVGVLMIGALSTFPKVLVPWALPAVDAAAANTGAYGISTAAGSFFPTWVHLDQFDLSSTSATARAALNGGYSASAQNAGPFAVNLNSTASSQSSQAGFRCAVPAE